MNLQKALLFSTLLSAVIIILFFSYGQQSNICIQSTFVQKVIYQDFKISNCTQNQKLDWNSKINKDVVEFNKRLREIEVFLKLKTNLALTVEILDPTNILYFTNNHLFISRNIFLNSQSFELFLIKNWIQNYNSNIKKNKLLEDLLVNFKYFLLFGKKAVVPLVQNFQPQIAWKQIQKSSHYNCITHWQLTNTLDLCINSSLHFFDTNSDFIYDRLYTKVFDSWVESLGTMNITQRYDLNENFKFHLIKFVYPVDQARAKEPSFTANLKLLSQFWSLNSDLPNTILGKKFLFGFLKAFNKYNYNYFVDNSKFDLIYFKQNLNLNTVYENKNINLVIKKFPNLKIAISNFKEIIILPLDKKIKLDVFTSLKANQILLEYCSKARIRDILNYERISDKVLLTYDCGYTQLKKVDQLVAQGASGFATQNLDVQFAQFHLPSLIKKRDYLNLDSEVFQYVQARNVKNSVYEVFGWQELNWDQVLKAYKPKAYVEGVGYFRTKFSYQGEFEGKNL